MEATEEIDGLELVARSISNTPSHVIADMRAVGGDDILGSFLSWIDVDPRIRGRLPLDFSSMTRSLQVIITYPTRNSIFPYLVSHNVTPIESIRIQGGYEYWTIYTLDDGAPANIFEDRYFSECEVTVVSAHGLNSLKRHRPVDDGDATLTPRQMDIATKALEMGYYNWPRRMSAKELARRLGLSPPTVLEHLRKSESRIVRSFLTRELEDREKRS